MNIEIVMQIFSLNVGRPQIVVSHGRQYSTAINRRPIEGRIALGVEGPAGDRVSDRNVHGGPDKAVCCYSREHYPYFAAKLGRELGVPSFGENFTTEGMLETSVCLGDRYRIGSAIVQVTQPRQPCSKLARKHDEPRMIEWVNERAFCGFYFRVLELGEVGAGDRFELIDRPQPDFSIERMMRIRLGDEGGEAEARRLAGAAELSESWRAYFQSVLEGEANDDD